MTPDRATLNFLNAFPEDNRKEGERLHKEGCVVQIFGTHVNIKGKVEEGRESCRTTIKLNGDFWEGECSCREGAKCASIVATMMERLARGGQLPESPNEVADQAITEILEEKLGRELKPYEDAFVEKLEKRYRRFEVEGHIVDHDLVRLNPKWPVESYDPIQLWPSAPADILEFWNSIAYHMRNKNLAYPPFMDTITDLEVAAESIREWEREKEIAEWNQTVCAFAEPKPTEIEDVEFRVLLTSSEARLQKRHPVTSSPSHPVKFATVTDWEQLREQHRNGALRMDGPSALILEEFLTGLGDSEGVALRMENAEHAGILNRMFHTVAVSYTHLTLPTRS